METMSLKTLAIKVLQRNQPGNKLETSSFQGEKLEGKKFPLSNTIQPASSELNPIFLTTLGDNKKTDGEGLLQAMPSKIRDDIMFSDWGHPFLAIFHEVFVEVSGFYETDLLVFIKERHPNRLAKLEGIKKELDRLYGIQAVHPRRRVKSEFRRFEDQVELWRQWFYHPLYLFINHESTAEQEEEKIEEEILGQEEAEEIIEDDDTWIDRVYQKSLDDLQCFHDCEHYGTRKSRELCPERPA